MAIVCLMTMVFVSCNSNITPKARDNYKQRLSMSAKEHNVDVTFNNEKILIEKNDIVVISFTVNACDKYGKYETIDFISVYAIDENGNIGTAIDTKYNWEKLFKFAKEIAKLENSAFSDEGKKLANKLKTDEGIYKHTAFCGKDDRERTKDELYNNIMKLNVK